MMNTNIRLNFILHKGKGKGYISMKVEICYIVYISLHKVGKNIHATLQRVAIIEFTFYNDLNKNTAEICYIVLVDVSVLIVKVVQYILGSCIIINLFIHFSN